MTSNIKLGDRVKDRISGFTGIIVCVSTWLNGCSRLTVDPETLKDGLPVESRTFDIEQLLLVQAGAFDDTKAKKSGGPKPDPIRR